MERRRYDIPRYDAEGQPYYVPDPAADLAPMEEEICRREREKFNSGAHIDDEIVANALSSEYWKRWHILNNAGRLPMRGSK